MENLDIGLIVGQLPNFIGLLIAILVQSQVIKTLLARIEKLEDVIIGKENC